MPSAKVIKLILDDFFEQSQSETKKRSISTSEESNFNKSLFEIEKHLYDLKKKHDVNKSINTSINSDHIMDSFSRDEQAFKSEEYVISFLTFLCLQKEHNAERLLEIMDAYFDLVKDKLTYSDLIITQSGATRCYTNLRFAINQLRKLGLIHSTIVDKHISTRRSLLPTPLGYSTALQLSNLTKHDVFTQLEKGNSFYLTMNSSKAKYFEFSDALKDMFSEEDKKMYYEAIEKINSIMSLLKQSDYSKQSFEQLEQKLENIYLNDLPSQKVSMMIRDWIIDSKL